MPRDRVKLSQPAKPSHTKRTPPIRHGPPAGIHGPVGATERAYNPAAVVKSHKKRLLQIHGKLEYLREQARRRGDAAGIARYDRKITQLLPHIEAAGILAKPSGNPLVKYAGKTIAGAGSFAYHAPGIAIVPSKALYGDIRHEQFNFPRSRAVSKAVALGTYETAKHPGRDPFQTGLLALSALSLGAGTASRLGAAGSALRGEGVVSALARPGYKGGSLLHRPPPGEIPLPGGVQALEHDNPFLNIGKRMRMRRVARAAQEGRRPSPLLPKRIGKEFTGQSVIAREARAREQVQADVENAMRMPAAAASKKLSQAEHDALRTVYVEGRHALRHPEETISRHVAAHERFAAEAEAKANKLEAALNVRLAQIASGKGPPLREDQQARLAGRINRERSAATLNRQVAQDLPNALSILKNPSEAFTRTLETGRRLQKQEERQLIHEGRLSPEASRSSRATAAEAYGRAPGIPPKGSVYFPMGERFMFPARGAKGGPASRVASAFGIGKPEASRYLMGTMHHRTGAAVSRGVVTHPLEAQATRAAGTARLRSVERSFAFLKDRSTPFPQSERDIPIRGKLTPELRQQVAAEAEHAATGDASALGRMKKLLAPLPHERQRYVNPDYIKEFSTSARGLSGVATFNKPFRFGGVYARPAYVVTNRPQNWIMRHLAQGSMRAKSIGHTAGGIRRELGQDSGTFIDGMGGEAKTESFNPTRGAGRYERGITQFVMDRTDRNERFLAVLARGWQKGVRTPEDWAQLKSDYLRGDHGAVNKVVAISRRARKDMVDFAVTPGERTVSDFIYFYPWLSRGSVWAGRFLAEHPAKSAAIGQFGQEMKREHIGQFGPIPSWLKGEVSTRFGLVNPNPLNTFATPAQIVDAVKNPAVARSLGEEFGTPAVQAFTTQPSQIPRRVIASLAPLSAAQRGGLIGHPSKTFPQTGLGPALGPFLVGGLYPRRADISQVHKQAYKELPAPQAFTQKMHDLRATLREQGVKALGAKSLKLPHDLDVQLRLHHTRYGAYKDAGLRMSDADYQQKAYAIDLQLLKKLGGISTENYTTAMQWAQRASHDDLMKERRKIGEAYFPSDWLNSAVKQLKEKGVKVTVPR